MTLTRRLLLLAVISVLPAIVIWTYTEVSLRRAREAEVNDLAIRQAQLVGAELERVFDSIHSLLLAVDETPSIRSFDTAACSPYLKAIQEKVPYILSFVAMDISGHIRCRPLGTTDTQHYFADRTYFHEALSKLGLVVGEYTPVFEEGGLEPRPVPAGRGDLLRVGELGGALPVPSVVLTERDLKAHDDVADAVGGWRDAHLAGVVAAVQAAASSRSETRSANASALAGTTSR